MSGCFGKLCATAASKQPVKRYNLLVLGVFPQNSPAVNEPLEVGVVRKIGKVQEYVAENQQRIPKVSRRFCRRIQRDLRSNKLGYVKISVHAYIVLLARGKSQDSNVMAKELIDGAPGVIGLLLGHAATLVQTLGLELLAHFIRVQQDADFFPNLETLVLRIVKFMVPNGVADDVNERSCAALRAMREFVALLQRTARGSSQLGTAHNAALTMLGSQRVASSRRALDVALVEGLSLQGDFTSDDAPSLAEGVLRNVAALAEDPVIGKEVVSRTLAHLDAKGAWLQQPLSSRALEILQSSLDELRLRALLVNVLVHHASAPSALSVDARAAVVDLAKLEVERLPPTLYFTSLAHAIEVLAPTLPVAAEDIRPSSCDSLHAAVRAYLVKLAQLMDGPELVLEVMAACLEKPQLQAEHRAARLACLLLLAEHVAARGAAGATVEHFPHMLLQELVLTIFRGSVRERALANRIFVTLLPSFRQPLKAAHAEQMQDALYEQLHPAAEHSPPQLAAAAEALSGLIERGAPSTLPRTCQLLLTLVTLCDLAPRNGRSCELVANLRACDHAAQLLIRRCLGASAAATVALPLRHWCANLRETADGHLEASCASFTGDEAQCLQLLNSMRTEGRINSYCVEMAAALARSPLIQGCGASEAGLLTEFRKAAAHPGPLGALAPPASSTAVLTALRDLDETAVDLSLDYVLAGARTSSNRDASSMPLADALDALTALTTGFQNDTASYTTPWSRGADESKRGEPESIEFLLPPAVDVVSPAEALFPRRTNDLDEPMLPVRPSTDDESASLQRVDSAQLPPVTMQRDPASQQVPAISEPGYWLGAEAEPAVGSAGAAGGAPAQTGGLPVRTRRRALHALAADEVGAMRNSSKPGNGVAGRATDDDSADEWKSISQSQADADEVQSLVSADDTVFDDAKSTLSRASFRSAVSRM